MVGGEGVKLSEMVGAGFAIPKGFILSSNAYFAFLRENKLADKIHDLLSTVNYERPDSVMQISAHIKKLIMHGSMSEELVKEIFFAYRKLSGIFRDASVAVYFSPTSEEITSSAHSGRPSRNDMYCKGEANLILRIREGWASFFEPRAIIYRHERKLGHFHDGMAVVVQKMVESDRSGVIFTVDPVVDDKTKIIIEAIYGLGELIVTPDRYEVNKADLEIINKVVAKQKVLLKKAGHISKQVRIAAHMAGKQKLTQNQILDLAVLGKKLENYYYFPQEIEWAIEKNRIYILRTRAIERSIRIASSSLLAMTGGLVPSGKMQLVLKGSPASPGLATGQVRIVHSFKDIEKIHNGDILVTAQTNRDYLSGIRKAGAVVTDHGGRASHAAIVSRDLGITAVVGTQTGTNMLRNGMIVTVNGRTGEIYKGTSVGSEYFKTATRVYVSLSSHGIASKVAAENVDGVGLLRGEAMMFDMGVHPKKLLREDRGEIYTNRLSVRLGFYCREFAARPVVYCLSDFKANEYRELEGGVDFERIEANPVLGYRGSFRHIQDLEVFKLEIEAIKMARQMGHKNLWMMVPFCRTVKELEEIKRIMTVSGIHRSSGFKLWMTIEVPSNVILLDKFIEAGIDGVSIGLDNLTTLILGIDRANSEVSRAFDSRDPAVLWAIERTIKTCHKHGISCSIFGQSISMFPDLLEKLVEWGISSVTVGPEVIESTRRNIFGIEKRVIEKKHYGKN